MGKEEEKAAAKVIYDAGNQLARQTRVNKDALVKLLRRAEDAFPTLGQSPSLKPAIDPFSNALIRHNLLQHKDKDVRVLVASCLCQIIRVLAPDPPFNDQILRDIFKLLISMFAELSDTKSPYFTRRVKILETVARLKCCLLLMDIGCDDLVLEMFNTFFSVVREHHQQSLLDSMLSIMILILEEKVTQPLLDVILRNLLKEEKGAVPTSFRLAVSVIEDCAEKIEPLVRGFLTSSILDRDSVESELKEYYHEIIFEIFQCAPEMLLSVIPSLSHELLTDQVDVRIKAVNLLGKLFALPGRHVVQNYRQLFVEFLKRFSDKSADVRISTLQCAKACYTATPSGSEPLEVLAAVEGRLLDFDDKVRVQAVITVCDLVKSNLKCIPPELILRAMERLRDKKVSVRKGTLQKLLDLYRYYCIQCSEGLITLGDHFEQIPCKILMLCYDKDCKDFRPQNMELVLAEDLFPTSLAMEERIKHWSYLFSIFTPAHIKAFNSILSQKWRLQTEMRVYMELRNEDKKASSDEVQKKIRSSCKKMSASFADPAKAEEWFEKLHQMKDEDIFNKLLLLLNEKTSSSADTREELLRRIEDKHPLYEFLRILGLKCSFNLFGSEHVHSILSNLLRASVGNKHLELEASSVNLLLNVVSASPSLLRGSEEELILILSEEENLFREKLLQILATASRFISIKLSDIYPSLETACLEGTRLQSKYAISSIAALGGSSDNLAFLKLYEKLVDSLHGRQNISTVLQSLSCIAQYSVSIYESREKEIIQVIEELFHETDVQSFDDLASFSKDYSCSVSCRLKIYGLKTLVKSFLPYQGTQVRPQMKGLFIIISKILPEGKFSDDDASSENDKAHIRLAAAKAVLKLASKRDADISPEIFDLVILKAQDPSALVRRLFLDKLHKLLKDHVIPSRYACGFALAASDSLKDLQANSLKYLEDFIKEHTIAARMRQNSSMPNQGTIMNLPGYLMFFLIHVLAHDPCFPSKSCQDEEAYARLCSPLIALLQTLVNANYVDSSKNVSSDFLSYMLNVFRAIKNAEDALDFNKTPNLHILADIGVLLVKVLSKNGMPSPAAGLMRLPSAFYKVSHDSRAEEKHVNVCTHCPLDENSVAKVLHLFQLTTIGTSSALAKGSEKSQGSSLKLDAVKHNTGNSTVDKEADKLTRRAKEDKGNSSLPRSESQEASRQVNTRGRNKQATSTSDNGLEGTIHHKKEVNGNTKMNLERTDFSSSCGSVITKPSTSGSQKSIQEVDVIQRGPLTQKDRKTTKRKSASEPCELSVDGLQNNCLSKGVGVTSESLVGQKIKLWSPIDKCFYTGFVDGFDSQNSSHKVSYDNGEVELLHLAREKWEIVSKISSPEEEAKKYCSTLRGSGFDSSISSTLGIVTRGKRASMDKSKTYVVAENDQLVSGMRKKKKARNLGLLPSDVRSVDESVVGRRMRTRSQKA